jgi:hypothetical protein
MRGFDRGGRNGDGRSLINTALEMPSRYDVEVDVLMGVR